MKNILKSMWAVAVAAMAFTSCSQDDAFDVNPDVEKVTINITAGSEVLNAESRTHLDGTPQVKWDAKGEALQVIENTTKMADAATTSATVSEDGLTAKFTVDLPKNTSASSYDYYAIYPAANFIDKSNSSLTEFKMLLPTEQTTVAGSFDPKADLLVSKKVTTATQATDLNFQFYRPISIVQLQLMGITKGETISSVVFENTKAALSGRLYYNWDTNTVTEYGYQGQAFKTINMTCNQVATGTDNVYFTSFPADLTDFTVTVSTDKATYTKTVKDIPADKLSFKAGHKANVRVSGMTREEKILDTYTLVTGDNYKTIAEGYKLIITNGLDEAAKAMGAKVADKNRMGITDITIETANGATVINSISTDVQVLALEGDATNGFLLSSEYGYLSLNGSQNELKHVKDASTASKWKISVAKNGNTDIQCGDRLVRFNSSYFASYKGTCSPVYAFFKKGTPKTALANPANLKATVAKGTNTVNVTWDAVPNAANYTVTLDYGTGNPVTQEVTTNSATIENLTWNTTATVYVVANPMTGDETYKSSAVVSTEITIGANPEAGKGTITELRSLMLKDANYDVKSYSGGVVYAYVAAEYGGKVAVVDNTGEVGSGLILYQASLPTGGVKEGQKIEIDLTGANRNVYNGLLQIKSAKVTIKDAVTTEIVKPIITATQFNTGDYQGMYVRINATTPATAGTWGDYPTMTGADNATFNTRASDQALMAISFSANKKGVIGGIADCFKAQQIVPQTEADVKAFKDTTPVISFTSTSYTASSSDTNLAIDFTRNTFATGNVTVSVTSGSNWLTVTNPTIANPASTINCTFSANTGAQRTATLNVSINGGNTEVITVTQSKYVDTSAGIPVGTVLWSEDWTNCTNSSQPKTPTGVNYGEKIQYTYVTGDTGTKIYNEALAGGTAPEMLVAKKSGSITASGIVVTGTKTLTLAYKTNSTAKSPKNLTITAKFNDGTSTTAVKSTTGTDITVPAGAQSMSIEIKNTLSGNARLDDITLTVKAIY